jgi:hypothetical protein
MKALQKRKVIGRIRYLENAFFRIRYSNDLVGEETGCH